MKIEIEDVIIKVFDDGNFNCYYATVEGKGKSFLLKTKSTGPKEPHKVFADLYYDFGIRIDGDNIGEVEFVNKN